MWIDACAPPTRTLPLERALQPPSSKHTRRATTPLRHYTRRLRQPCREILIPVKLRLKKRRRKGRAKSGKVRALGVSGARRSPAFPAVPTRAEAGVAGYEAATWTGVVTPANLPRPILDRLNAAVNRAIASAGFRDRFSGIGDEAAGGTPEEFAALIRRELGKSRDVVKRSGARFD